MSAWTCSDKGSFGSVDQDFLRRLDLSSYQINAALQPGSHSQMLVGKGVPPRSIRKRDINRLLLGPAR